MNRHIRWYDTAKGKRFLISLNFFLIGVNVTLWAIVLTTGSLNK